MNDLGALIGFFAAIYLSIGNRDLYKRIWTPDYYDRIRGYFNEYVEKVFPSPKSSELKNRIEGVIEKLNKRIRTKGTVMLIVSIVLLVSLGYENYLQTYRFLLAYSAFFIALVTAVESVWERIAVSFVALFVGFEFYVHQMLFSSFVVCTLIVCALFIPALCIIFHNYLYSTVYLQYLKTNLSNENRGYQQSRVAVEQKKKTLMARKYENIFANAFFSDSVDKDGHITELNKAFLNNVNQYYQVPTKMRLIIFALSHKTQDDSTEIIQPETTSSETVLTEKNVLGYVKQYEALKPQPTIAKFCEENRLNEEEFRQERKKYIQKS